MKHKNWIKFPEISPLVLRIGISLVLMYLLPILLYEFDSPWLGYSYTKEASIFEYFGFVGSVIVLINIGIEYSIRKNEGVITNIFLIAFFLFIYYQLILYSESSKIGWDYNAYQESVRALLYGQSPYFSELTANHPYIYPPLLAQTLFLVYKVINWTWIHITSEYLSENEIFFLLFYTYQFVQFLLTLFCYFLSYKFARSVNLGIRTSVILVTLLFAINLPLYRNFGQNQINLWILMSLLLSFLWIEKKPVLAGFIIAFGSHLKLYPVVQCIPWIISKKWLVLLSFLSSLVGIFLLQVSFDNSFVLWQHFISYLLTKVERGVALRNNSIYSFSYSINNLFINNQDLLKSSAIVLSIVFTIISLIWIFLRIRKRTNSFTKTSKEVYLGNAMDIIFLMFLVSPSVWDHHLVSMIPLIIWAIAKYPKKVNGLISLSIILIFFFPTYDVFFFSYQRLLGLVILMIATTPVQNDELHSQVIELFPFILEQNKKTN